MAFPSSAINRFDLSLAYSQFNLAASRKGFIAHRVLAPIAVSLQATAFLKVLIASVLNKTETTKRAPKAGYRRDDYEWSQDSYSTEDHGVEEVVDDRSIKMYGNEIRAEQIHRDRAIDRLLRAFEVEGAAAVFNTATWTGASLTTAVGTAWSNKANCDPVANVDAAKDKVVENIGQAANAIILEEKCFRNALRSDRIEGLVKYSGSDDPKSLVKRGVAVLQDLFQLEHIIVAGQAVKNTADKGQTPSLSRIWDSTKAMVCRVAEAGSDLEDHNPCIGRTIMWQEENGAIPGAEGDEMAVLVEEYREENRRGGIIRARNDRVFKILHAEAGHLLTGL